MPYLVLVGLNHRTADVECRERAAFQASHLTEALERLFTRPGIKETMIVSTCNRVELLAVAENNEEGIETLEAFLSDSSGLPRPELNEKLYHHTGEQVVRHIFRVASSLDSMILGEPQILGQVKGFYAMAVEAQTVGTYLNSLLQAAFRTAKRVRSETSIGEYSVSVSSAAVDLARKIFGDLHDKGILIVGAGKMGEMAVRHLVSGGAGSISVINRSAAAAQELATRFRGTAIPYEHLLQAISRSDIIITSTGSREILIDHDTAHAVMQGRRNAPIVFIDISVPRNVDPSVASIDNVFCYDIDDLGAVVEANIVERRREAALAEKIVEQEVESFAVKLRSMDMTPMAIHIQERIQEICRTELQRYLTKAGHRDAQETQELETMVARIAGKIAHPLLAQLKSAPQDPLHQEAYLDMIRRIFKLQKDNE